MATQHARHQKPAIAGLMRKNIRSLPGFNSLFPSSCPSRRRCARLRDHHHQVASPSAQLQSESKPVISTFSNRKKQDVVHHFSRDRCVMPLLYLSHFVFRRIWFFIDPICVCVHDCLCRGHRDTSPVYLTTPSQGMRANLLFLGLAISAAAPVASSTSVRTTRNAGKLHCTPRPPSHAERCGFLPLGALTYSELCHA